MAQPTPTRPGLASRLSSRGLRLRSYPSQTHVIRPTRSSPTTSSPESPNNANNNMGDSKNGQLVLRIKVVKGRDLAPKDKSGTSDPYLALRLGDARETTSAINKTLNPEWNQTIEMPVTGENSLVLEACCWDKDRFGKDYMGEFAVALEELFQIGEVKTEPRWYPLDSKRNGKKSSVVTGAIQLECSIYDSSNASASAQEILSKLGAISGAGTPPLGDEDDSLDKFDGADPDDDNHDVDEGDEGKPGETAEKKKRRLRLARLKKKAKQRGYEFTTGSDVAGVLFLEVQKITDLPPERNVTRTSFDMDPFVIISLGRKTFRTKVVRHNLNPVYNEKLVFQVLKHEVNYSISISVVDRDQFSGNDYVGTVNFPLEQASSCAPTADPQSGLYDLPDVPDTAQVPTASPELKKPRFRLPLSRSSSAQSLNKLAKPSLQRSDSSEAMSRKISPETLAPPPTSAPGGNASQTDAPADPMGDGINDPSLRSYVLPLEMKNKERWEEKHKPTVYIRAKYLPYRALRQQFWRAMLKQYDADDSGRIDKIELTTMLDTLGSTLKEQTIDGFFARYPNAEVRDVPSMSFDQAIICLEDQLQKTLPKKQWHRPGLPHNTSTMSSMTLDDSEPPSGAQTPLNFDPNQSSVPTIQLPHLGEQGEEGENANQNDLSDDRGEEHVIEIRECPICHQPRLNKRTDADIITHVATCASQDWRQVNNIVMAGFVTSSQAQRKWYSKVVSKVGYGGYKLGANSANILVQDRITGQINEERMSVYVRLGIRLLYKGLKANNMERQKIKKMLRSMSVKQGVKYDDPASAAQIPGFINFHQLDMSEVAYPPDGFKSFNEFFYRALKPDARPCSAPDRPQILTSPADCRTVVFNTLDEAQKIWVKGRDFTVEKLLAGAYPDDAKRYHGGALGIFRLAPQDYHRFHIPVDGVLGEPKSIDGEYYTVNPMAIRSALDVYGENIRVCVPIDSEVHGRVMFICIGAMMVGSTVITRKRGEKVKRAEELGYFKFGGSTVLLLFEPGQMVWDEDLVTNSSTALETLVRVGMSVGHSPDHAPHTPDMQKENPSMAEMQDAKRRIEGSLAPDSTPSPMPDLAAQV